MQSLIISALLSFTVGVYNSLLFFEIGRILKDEISLRRANFLAVTVATLVFIHTLLGTGIWHYIIIGILLVTTFALIKREYETSIESSIGIFLMWLGGMFIFVIATIALTYFILV